MSHSIAMQTRTAVLGIVAGFILGASGAAEAAVDHGPGADVGKGCDPAAKPAEVQRTETSGPVVIIRATWINTASTCNRRFGIWRITGQHVHQYKMYARDSKRPCAAFIRTSHGVGDPWTAWKSQGRATNC